MQFLKKCVTGISVCLLPFGPAAVEERRPFVYPTGNVYRAEIGKPIGPVFSFTLYNGAVFFEYSRKGTKYMMEVNRYYFSKYSPPTSRVLHSEEADMPGRHIAEPEIAILDCKENTLMADNFSTAGSASRWVKHMFDSLKMNGRLEGCEKWEEIKKKISQGDRN